MMLTIYPAFVRTFIFGGGLVCGNSGSAIHTQFGCWSDVLGNNKQSAVGRKQMSYYTEIGKK